MEKAIQVMVRETMEDGYVQAFGGVLIGNQIIAMDNGDILDATSEHLEIVEELPWISLSDELLGE